MQTSLDILDWDELKKKFHNSDEFAAWRLDLADNPAWIMSGEHAGWENDSANFYMDFSEALKKAARKLPRSQRILLDSSLRNLIAGTDEDAIQDFPCSAESCYFMALSPQRVASIATNLSSLNLPALAKLLVTCFHEPDPEDGDEEDDEGIAIVRIWRRTMRRIRTLLPKPIRHRLLRDDFSQSNTGQDAEILKTNIDHYLQQATAVVNNARQRGWGIIGHCG